MKEKIINLLGIRPDGVTICRIDTIKKYPIPVVMEPITEEQETNKYYEGKDIRFVINDIKYNNNLKDSNLYEGMELKIPSM